MYRYGGYIYNYDGTNIIEDPDFLDYDQEDDEDDEDPDWDDGYTEEML